MNTVSIIIATYNRADYLRDSLRTLAPALARSGMAAEVLVVNNACTDHTDRVVAEFQQAHPQIPLQLIHEEQPGLSRARNAGLAHATGEMICFLDDDVLVPEEWLTELVKAFTLDEKVGCIAGRIKLSWPDTQKPSWVDDKYNGFYSQYEHGDESNILPPGDIFYGANFAFTRQLVDRVGEFNTSLGRKGALLLSGEDAEYAKRIWKHGFTIAYSATGYVYHRVAPERLTAPWLYKRYFWQGVTSYYAAKSHTPAYPLYNIPKLLSNLLVLPFTCLLLNKRLIYRTLFRIANALGPFYGWYLHVAKHVEVDA